MAAPVVARILNVAVRGGYTLATIGVGSKRGVAKSWRGTLIRTDKVTPRPDGALVILSVRERETVVRSTLTPDQIRRSPYVRLEP